MKYIVDYPFRGGTYGVLIDAENWDEASERIRSIGNYGTVKGEYVMTIPGHLGWLARLLVWMKNL